MRQGVPPPGGGDPLLTLAGRGKRKKRKGIGAKGRQITPLSRLCKGRGINRMTGKGGIVESAPRGRSDSFKKIIHEHNIIILRIRCQGQKMKKRMWRSRSPAKRGRRVVAWHKVSFSPRPKSCLRSRTAIPGTAASRCSRSVSFGIRDVIRNCSLISDWGQLSEAQSNTAETALIPLRMLDWK